MDILTFLDEDQLQSRLDGMNERGEPPEVPAVDAHGQVFIAALVDFGDEAPMHFVRTTPEGRVWGDHDCPACRCSVDPWRPTFPVRALVQRA